MNNTIKDFFDKTSKEILNRISLNILEKKRDEMVLNLYQLYFDFSKQQITIEYYVEDDNYPATAISFAEFKKLAG